MIVASWGDNKEGAVSIWNLEEGIRGKELTFNKSGVSQILFEK